MSGLEGSPGSEGNEVKHDTSTKVSQTPAQNSNRRQLW